MRRDVRFVAVSEAVGQPCPTLRARGRLGDARDRCSSAIRATARNPTAQNARVEARYRQHLDSVATSVTRAYARGRTADRADPRLTTQDAYYHKGGIMYSKAKIADHPLHPMLVGFPVAFYVGTLAGSQSTLRMDASSGLIWRSRSASRAQEARSSRRSLARSTCCSASLARRRQSSSASCTAP